MNFYEKQYLTPSNFLNGINVGNFNVEGQLSPGLPAGLVQPYIVSPTLAESEFLVGLAPANSTTFVNLSGVLDTENNGYVIVNGSLENPGLKFDCERGIKIRLRENGSVLISGYDRYEQKMTWGSALTKDVYVNITRAFAKISSIQITNSAGNPADYSFTSTYDIGLPFNALAGITPLAVSIESTNDFFNILLMQSVAPGNAIQNYYTYYATETETLSTGRARPMINVNPQNMNVYYTFNGSEILSVWQLVYGAGTLPHYMNDPDEYSQKVNSLETVIGVPPYKDGWIGWQG